MIVDIHNKGSNNLLFANCDTIMSRLVVLLLSLYCFNKLDL